MSLATLRAMASGGMYDQVGGGFARYSVDRTWTVPHFEKMLYDNALLARAYLHGWQVSGDAVLRRVVDETLDWVLREMRAPEGGFYSALDADSEGVEGKFYVWTLDELRAVLGTRLRRGDRVLRRDRGAATSRATNVLEARGRSRPSTAGRDQGACCSRRATARVRPGLDDKRLTAWNALMISALAEAGAVLGRRRLLDAARDAARVPARPLRDADGRLLRTYNDGRAKLDAYLEDHAFLVEALLDALRGDVRGRAGSPRRARSRTR